MADLTSTTPEERYNLGYAHGSSGAAQSPELKASPEYRTGHQQGTLQRSKMKDKGVDAGNAAKDLGVA